MAILITTSIKGQTPGGYDQVAAFLKQPMQLAPGFILHIAYGTEDGVWHVTEVWNSKKESDEFFAKMVAPNLPKGIIPKRSYQEVHSVISP